MKWSFLAGLMASASVLAPTVASAKVSPLSGLEGVSSAALISNNLFQTKLLSSSLKSFIQENTQQQLASSELTQLKRGMEILGLGARESAKAQKLDAVQLSRGLGMRGGEGGSLPSSSVAIKIKDDGVTIRPGMSSVQRADAVNNVDVEMEKGPSLASSSLRTEGPTFTTPSQLQTTVGHPQEQGQLLESSPRSNTRSSVGQQTQLEPTQSLASTETPERDVISAPSFGGTGDYSALLEERAALFATLEKVKAERARETSQSIVPPAPPLSPPLIQPREHTRYEAITPAVLKKAKKKLKAVRSVREENPLPVVATAPSSSEGTTTIRPISERTEISTISSSPNATALSTSSPNLTASLRSNQVRAMLSPSERAPSVSGLSVLSAADRALLERALQGRTQSGRSQIKLESIAAVEEAARFFGFDLSTSYSDLAAATKALVRLFGPKNTRNQASLEMTNPNTNPTEFARLMQEGADLERHKASLEEYFKIKFARIGGARIVQVRGEGSAAMFEAIRRRGATGAAAHEPTVAELEVEIATLETERSSLEEEERKCIQSDQLSRAAQLRRQQEELRDKKISKKNQLVALEQKERAARNRQLVTSTETVDPAEAARRAEATRQAQEARTQQIRAFTASNPELVPFLELLDPQEQLILLTTAIDVTYNRDGTYPATNPTSKNNKKHPVSVVRVIARLTPAQREAFVGAIRSRTDDNSRSQSSTRLTALKFAPNYVSLGFQFPAWTADQAPPRSTPVRAATTVVRREDEATRARPTAAVTVETGAQRTRRTRSPIHVTTTRPDVVLNATPVVNVPQDDAPLAPPPAPSAPDASQDDAPGLRRTTVASSTGRAQVSNSFIRNMRDAIDPNRKVSDVVRRSRGLAEQQARRKLQERDNNDDEAHR